MKKLQSTFYEVAISYVNDEGTETIKCFDKLDDAKQFVKNYNLEAWMDFLFIDKSTCDLDSDGNPCGHANRVEDFVSLMYKDNEFKSYNNYYQSKLIRERETLDNNRLIAEFMKWKKVNAGLIGYETPHSVALFQPDEMLFNKSWDWLMPVVEKIERLGYTFEKNYQRVDKDWQSLIVKGNDILYQEFNNDSLKSSYYVVVKFIKQHNTDEGENKNYPFKEGDTYFTIEDNDVVESTWDYVSEQIHDKNPNRKYFTDEKSAMKNIFSNLFSNDQDLQDLKVTSIRYFETRRGLGYECKTNNKEVSIWNDGNGGITYIDGNEYTQDYQMVNELKKMYTDSMLENLINKYENV